MPRSASLPGILSLALLLAAGCGTPKEVAVVTERPVPLPSTETPPPPPPEVAPTPLDTVRARRFDTGKMWTFDNPPVEYFAQAYGFRPDSAWFARARLGALRFSTYCSASFVSPTGLVMTNHHCGRESIAKVGKEGEKLLDNGFYARSLDEERKVKDLYVEQLLAIEDVTERVLAAGRAVRGDDEKAQARRDKIEQIEKDMTASAQREDSTLQVQVIELYNGGKYSAYTFRRYGDVRLVMAPEHQLGYFGGDDDNFTYPRYALDMAFFRVYDAQGRPLKADQYFRWSAAGSRPGEPVFVVGNPGSTSRLNTTSGLAFERDYELPQQLAALESRAALLKAYLDAQTKDADVSKLRNTYFQITNSVKANTGQLKGLHDPYLMARRAAAENQFRQAIAARDSLKERYGGLFQDIGELQLAKAAIAPRLAAFTYFGSQLDSRVLTRALYGYFYDTLKRRGYPPDRLAEIRKEALQIADWPVEVEQAFIARRLHEVQDALGTEDPTVRRVLEGQPIDSVAARLATHTALVDSAGFAGLLDAGYLGSGDASVPVIEALGPLYFQVAGQQQSFQNREEILNAQLARARFDLYGTAIPPDASFSLRIADGVVKGYAYNGTLAPPYTTFYGLYDDYHAYKTRAEWNLPDRWLQPPPSFDLATPLNLVTTADITGGNSGSPLLNKDLEVVGLIFDGNIESLPNNYLYTDEAARSVAVDARGILEALDDIYDADRLVLELTTGRMAATEDEADAALGSR